MLRGSLAFLIAASLSAAELTVVSGDALQKELSAYLLGEAKEHWSARRAAVAALKTPEQVAARRQYIQDWLARAMGPRPEKTPLNARLTGGFQRDGYRVEHLVFESMPGFYVTANVYVPTAGASGPFPAVIGTAGHSNTGKAVNTYQSAWIGLAKLGFLVLAFDPAGQGERNEYLDSETGKSLIAAGVRQHDMVGTQCLLTGTTFARYEYWDAVRAIDYLLTRPDVDRQRIGVAGNSGGGTQSAYLGVLEPRLAAGVISCYMTRWEELWQGPGPQDSEQNFPGFISAGLDFGDFIIGAAPKPITMLTGIRDYFPIEGGRQTYAEVKRVYDVLGSGDCAGYFEHDDEHGWHQPRRQATYRWLAQWLQGRKIDGTEPPIQVEPEEKLNATKTGQVATSFGGETVFSLNRKLAEQQYASRRALKASPVELRGTVARVLNLPARSGTPQVTKVSSDGNATRLLIETEEGIRIPAVLVHPAGAKKHRVTIVLDGRGKKDAAARINALVESGSAVLALDPRGFGESAPPTVKSGYSAMYQLAQRAMLLGRPLVGMQVFDVLRAFDYLRSRDDVDASQIALSGAGHGGVVAMYAAALEPAFASVEVQNALPSYMSVVRTRIHGNPIGLIVPGVLSEFDLPDLARLIAPRTLQIQ